MITYILVHTYMYSVSDVMCVRTIYVCKHVYLSIWMCRHILARISLPRGLRFFLLFFLPPTKRKLKPYTWMPVGSQPANISYRERTLIYTWKLNFIRAQNYGANVDNGKHTVVQILALYDYSQLSSMVSLVLLLLLCYHWGCVARRTLKFNGKSKYLLCKEWQSDVIRDIC